MNSGMDRRGFLKAMLVLAGSVIAPSIISAGPRESIYIPKIRQAKPYANISIYHTGNTIYLSMSGDDLKGNGTLGNPYKTIRHGMSQVKEGGIVHLMPGIYQT